MSKSAKGLISASLLFVIALLTILVLYTSPSYSDAPQFSPKELTPWAYLPFIRKDPSPAIIRIVNVHYASLLPAAYEYVELENQGGSPQNDMDGWELTDRVETAICKFQGTFPLQPGNRIKVWTKCGYNDENNIFCCLSSWEWLWNASDTARLYNEKHELVHEYSY